MGAAFYAGWGLTDDRVILKRRGRKLSLQNLFAGAYFIYPRYLANLSDSAKGFKTSCYRIAADRYAETFNHFKQISDLYLKDNDEQLFEHAIKSDFWPVMMMKQATLSEQQLAKIVAGLNYQKLLINEGGKIYQIGVLYFLLGCLKSDYNRNDFLTRARRYVDIEVLNKLLIDMCHFFPGTYLTGQFQWLVENRSPEDPSTVKLDFDWIKPGQTKDGGEDGHERDIKLVDPLESYKDEKNFSVQITNLRSNIHFYETEKFIDVVKPLLLATEARGKVNTILFVIMAQMASQIGDLASTRALSTFLRKMNLYGHNNAGLNTELENLKFDQSVDAMDTAIQLVALQMKLNPNRINRTWGA